MENLGTLPGGNFGISSARAVSADGSVIVGHSDSSTNRQPFRWTQTGGMMSLSQGTIGSASAVTADGQVVVGYVEATSPQAFRWTPSSGLTVLGDLVGGTTFSSAAGVSADGSVVVGTGNSANGTEAFRWTASNGFEGLGDLAGGTFSSRANAVSADGSIVVGRSVTFASSSESAFIWDNVHGMRSLRDVLQLDYGLNVTGWSLREATAISADGMTIVGNGSHNQSNLIGWVAHIPEPNTISLLALGVMIVRLRTPRACDPLRDQRSVAR